MQQDFKEIMALLALLIEFAAVIVVTFGAAQAFVRTVGWALHPGTDIRRGKEIWLRFATWILLSLEFALAADIVRTAVAPTWADIGQLAAIATIRTVLNYFLGKDIEAFQSSGAAADGSLGAPAPRA
jgi:uncharacterized membrane protein